MVQVSTNEGIKGHARSNNRDHRRCHLLDAADAVVHKDHYALRTRTAAVAGFRMNVHQADTLVDSLHMGRLEAYLEMPRTGVLVYERWHGRVRNGPQVVRNDRRLVRSAAVRADHSPPEADVVRSKRREGQLSSPRSCRVGREFEQMEQRRGQDELCCRSRRRIADCHRRHWGPSGYN